SLEAAEAVKLVNNCHTDLIYSFGNEVAPFAERLTLDPLELIRAANVDYPRPDLARPGFVGGGCLSKDPYILIASSIAAGYEPWLVARARGLNEYLPLHVARRFVELIRETRGAVAGGRVLLLGFAYKGWPPTDDMRGAAVLPILDVLRTEGLALHGHDFLVAPGQADRPIRAGRSHGSRVARRPAAGVGSGLRAGRRRRRPQHDGGSGACDPGEHAGDLERPRVADGRCRGRLLRLDERGLRRGGGARAGPGPDARGRSALDRRHHPSALRVRGQQDPRRGRDAPLRR